MSSPIHKTMSMYKCVCRSKSSKCLCNFSAHGCTLCSSCQQSNSGYSENAVKWRSLLNVSCQVQLICVKCSHSAKIHLCELMCTECQSNLHVCSCLRAVTTCSDVCVFITKGLFACHPNSQCTSSSLAGWCACMCETV